MGGSTYEREVYGSTSSAAWGASSTSTKKMANTKLDTKLNPKKKAIKSTSKHPIVIFLDVTGSNINFARLIYDKLPMLYGQIEQKKYLPEFEISISAVGDAYGDNSPLQIGEFAKGIDLDPIIERIVLEGCGGAGLCETYELAAYYALHYMEFDADAEPYILFIADEMMYPTVSKNHVRDILGHKIEENVPSSSVFKDLQKKCKENVFVFLNKYSGREFRSAITEAWVDMMPPQHVIKIQEEKSIVDLILGVLSVSSGARTVDSYVVDMKERKQTDTRISNVLDPLKELESSIVPAIFTSSSLTKSSGKHSPKRQGKRL